MSTEFRYVEPSSVGGFFVITRDWRLHVLTDRTIGRGRPLQDIVGAAIAGGATIIQLREKTASTRDMIALGHAAHELTRIFAVPLIINDRIDVALAIDAEGAHMGQDDTPAALARQLLGPNKILGVSAGSVAEARKAEADGADYIGVGDIFGTSSKPDADPPIGIAVFAEIIRVVSIPVVGIGGITLNNASRVMEAGAAGIAVISAVVGAQDVEAATRQLRMSIDRRIYEKH